MILKIVSLAGLMALSNGQKIKRTTEPPEPVFDPSNCSYGYDPSWRHCFQSCGLGCCQESFCEYGVDSGNCKSCPCPCYELPVIETPAFNCEPPECENGLDEERCQANMCQCRCIDTEDCGFPCCPVPECGEGTVNWNTCYCKPKQCELPKCAHGYDYFRCMAEPCKCRCFESCGIACCEETECKWGVDAEKCTSCPCPCLDPPTLEFPKPECALPQCEHGYDVTRCQEDPCNCRCFESCGLPCCDEQNCKFGVDWDNCTSCPCSCLPPWPTKRMKCRNLK